MSLVQSRHCHKALVACVIKLQQQNPRRCLVKGILDLEQCYSSSLQSSCPLLESACPENYNNEITVTIAVCNSGKLTLDSMTGN